jgi:hypothetical protein
LTEDILEHLVSLEHRPWPTWRRDKPITERGLADLLKPLYRRDAVFERISRYLPDQVSSRQNSNNDGPKHHDGTGSKEGPKSVSVSGFEPESIGLLTGCHIEGEGTGMSGSNPPLVVLANALSVPIDALTLLWRLESAGLNIKVDGDGLAVGPRERLTNEDRALIRRWRDDLLAAVVHCDRQEAM